MSELVAARPVKTKEELVAETKATLRRAMSSSGQTPSRRERRSSGSVDRPARPAPVKRKPDRPRLEVLEPSKELKREDSKTLRYITVFILRYNNY